MARSAVLVLVSTVLLAAFLSGQDQTGFPRLPPPPVKSPPDTTAPDIPGVVVGGTKVHLIRDLCHSTEGPIAMPDGSLLFTEQDAGDGRLVRIGTNGKISTYVDNTNRTIGLAYDAKGRLIGTQSHIPRVGVLHPVRVTLAEEFEGVPLLAPNDLVIDKKGGIYFTDPLGGRFRPVPPGRTTAMIFYIRPQDGKLLKVSEEVANVTAGRACAPRLSRAELDRWDNPGGAFLLIRRHP